MVDYIYSCGSIFLPIRVKMKGRDRMGHIDDVHMDTPVFTSPLNNPRVAMIKMFLLRNSVWWEII